MEPAAAAHHEQEQVMPPPGMAVKKKEKKETKERFYKSRCKKHKDSVVALRSLDGPLGTMFMSGSNDHTVRSK